MRFLKTIIPLLNTHRSYTVKMKVINFFLNIVMESALWIFRGSSFHNLAAEVPKRRFPNRMDIFLYGTSDVNAVAPNDTAYKRWSCHSGLKLRWKLCRTFPPPQWGPIYCFWACRPCGPAEWLALLLTKAGDAETNPGPTTLNKQVWICDICHKQIHVRKQISIRCNRIKHCVHLSCAGIRQAQATDTWTCHLHRESRLTPHTDITPPHRSRPWSKPPTHSPPTPPQLKHTHMSNIPPVPT